MLRTILVASLLAAGTPVLAQSAAESGTASDTAGMAAPAQATDPGTITVEQSLYQQMQTDRAVPTVVATKGEIRLAVDTEWFKFDRDRNGGLDQTEFGQMLRKFRKAAAQTLTNGPEDASRANAAAFATADTDKDGKVNRDEFVALLQSPAAG